MKRKIVPHIVNGQDLWTLGPATNLQAAVELMAERRIGAVMVVADDGMLAGIFSERDLLNRVVAKGRDPRSLSVADVMTPNPTTVAPDDTAASALDLMRKGGFRHLPVADGGKPVGMVSIRDLYAAVASSLEEELQERDAIMFGTGYGGR